MSKKNPRKFQEITQKKPTSEDAAKIKSAKNAKMLAPLSCETFEEWPDLVAFFISNK